MLFRLFVGKAIRAQRLWWDFDGHRKWRKKEKRFQCKSGKKHAILTFITVSLRVHILRYSSWKNCFFFSWWPSFCFAYFMSILLWACIHIRLSCLNIVSVVVTGCFVWVINQLLLFFFFLGRCSSSCSFCCSFAHVLVSCWWCRLRWNSHGTYATCLNHQLVSSIGKFYFLPSGGMSHSPLKKHSASTQPTMLIIIIHTIISLSRTRKSIEATTEIV